MSPRVVGPRATCAPLLLLLALVAPLERTRGHAPTSIRTPDARRPVHLGDATSDSWAAFFEMNPGQDVAYYSFDAVSVSGAKEEKLWLGTYVPACRGGCPEDDFTFHVGVWGMPGSTACAGWDGGWGGPGTVVANATVPAYVAVAGTPFASAGPRLVLRGAPSDAQPDVFEPYTPMVFRPRGGCVAEFPSVGRYYVAVWSDNLAASPRHVALGIGLAERSVFQPGALLFGGFTTLSILEWARWSWISLFLWPVFAATTARAAARYWGWRPARPSLQLAVLGQVVWGALGVSTLLWSVQVADQGGSGWPLPLAMRVALPLFLAYTVARTERRWVLVTCAFVALVTGSGLLIGPVLILCVAATPMGRAEPEDGPQQP